MPNPLSVSVYQDHDIRELIHAVIKTRDKPAIVEPEKAITVRLTPRFATKHMQR